MATTALGTAAPRPFTVLVIDGDVEWARTVARALCRDFHVVQAHDDRAAIRALERHDVDVIVSDVTVGRRTAAALHTAVARLCPGLERRIVFTTCGGFDEALRLFFEHAENPVLYKSRDLRGLRRAVEELLLRAEAA